MEAPRVITVTLEDQGLERPAADFGRCAHRERWGASPVGRRCPRQAVRLAEDGEPYCAEHLPSVRGRKAARRR